MQHSLKPIGYRRAHPHRHLRMQKTLMASALAFFALTAQAGTSTSFSNFDSPGLEKALHLPAFSQHFKDPKERNRRWSEEHPGIGIEWRDRRNDGTVLKYSTGIVRDSFSVWGGYAGVSWQKELYASTTWRIDAGATALLWYRALKFEGSPELVPGVAPVLSLEHVPTGVGVNVFVVAPAKIGSWRIHGATIAQFTKTF